MPPETHYHACIGFCSPTDPTRADPAAEARAETADAIAIACAARASDAATEPVRATWWAAADLARRYVTGDADVVG